MDIQMLQQGLQGGLQQPLQQGQPFFNPQTQQQPGQMGIPQTAQQMTVDGDVLRIPLLFVIMGINIKCFLERRLSTGTLQEAYSVLQQVIQAGWPVDGWQPRQDQGQYQQQGQGYGQQGGYQPRQGYNNGYNRGGYRSNYRRY